ncbi:MAG: SDR family NAD(P)-dependent oxidoreductase, partial [Acidimicrobiales bacterium]|nr:SDR family NAD(P)-dependent oxidoreductase [Acidimicrobiales bacterium]
MGLKVMVTGGTGFIGGHLLRALVDAGHTPRVLVRSPEKLATVQALHGLPEIEYVVGDITDRAAVDAALEGCDACIHTAAVTALKSSEADSIGANNVTGGTTVLDA